MRLLSKQPGYNLLSTVHRQCSIRSSPPRLSTTITTALYSFSTMTSPSPSSLAMPPMLYGTAWKKDRTADLVYQAIKSGFRGIDTAAMKRHYDEALTGEGIRRAINEGIVSRGDLWIQTKFTPQDPSLVSHGSIPSQIAASVTSSLSNLSASQDSPAYLDALILHSPFPTTSETLQAWSALLPFVESGQIRYLGISNTPLSILQHLYSQAGEKAKPFIVQNRFRAAEYSWDFETRRFCKERGIKYQGFWTLTGNPGVWQTRDFVREVAEGAGVGMAEAWYTLMMDAGGIVVLNGTTNEGRMKGDLEAVAKVKQWRETDEGRSGWERAVHGFRVLVDKGGE